MIQIECRYFRGCERADITCAPVALVAGKNAAGKSSLAQAIAAVLTGDPLPIAGVTKAAAGLLVKSGTETGRVTIKTESGTARVDWPNCVASADGTPPHASRWAAGIASVATLAPRERARVIGEYLHADPERDDLKAALTEVELGNDQTVAAIWQLVTEQGWDNAHTLRKEKGAELKGQWKQAAGVNYGSRIAVSWLPPDWVALNTGEVDLRQARENDLLAAVAQAKDANDKAIADAALSGAARETLQATADDLETRKDALQQAEAAADRIHDELQDAQNVRAGLSSGNTDPGLPCPHCGAYVVLRQVDLTTRELVPAATDLPNAAELKARRLAIAEADGTISNLTAAAREADRAVDRARDAMQLATLAVNQLAQMPPATIADDPREAAAGALNRANRRLAAWRQKRQADEIQQKIAGNDLVLGILAPDGLRTAKLARVLELFNLGQLGRFSRAAGWSQVAIDAEMTITYGGRPYPLLSTSEQYRVRATLQVAMAHVDGSAMVVLDAADVLDATSRGGLFPMLEEGQLPAVVCMTLARREQVPDLEAAGFGFSYWLDSGVCQAINPPKEVAA